MIGTCTLGQVINVIKESEMDRISTSWVTVRLSQLLSRRVVAEGTPGRGAEEANMPREKEVDAVVEMKSSTHVGPFQMEILEGRLSQAPTHNTHVMVTPLGCTEAKRDGGHQLPPGIQVLHVYTTLTANSKQIPIVVRNVTDQAIFLKKGAQVAHVVSVDLAPLEEAPSKLEDTQTAKERMTVRERQDKLLEKLNLDGLSEWTPRNATTARELLLSYHDAFALEPDELGCTSAIEHEIHLTDEEPFKERFRHIPPPLLEEICASLRDMLEAGAIRPSQSPWCNPVVLVRKKDGSLRF